MSNALASSLDTDYRWLQIDPVDAWFFRDGKPFNRGQDHADSRSLFPPASNTVVGTIRYNLGLANGWSGRGSWCEAKHSTSEEVAQVLGDGTDLGQLAFLGPLIVRGDEPMFAMPRHVLGVREPDRHSVELTGHVFRPVDWLGPANIGSSDLSEACLPSPLGIDKFDKYEQWPDIADDYMVTRDGMSRILAGELPELGDCVEVSNLFQIESRVGIGRDPHRRGVNPGELYNPHFVRTNEGVGVTMGVTGIPSHWTVPSLIAFGGESRMAGISAGSGPRFDVSVKRSNQYLVILLTPAMFVADGTSKEQHEVSSQWIAGGAGGPAEGLNDALSGTIQTVAVDRPQRIGGWDSVHGKPIDKRPYAPAGTVWWIDAGDAENVPEPGDLIQLGTPRSREFGYGLAVCAAWPQRVSE